MIELSKETKILCVPYMGIYCKLRLVTKSIYLSTDLMRVIAASIGNKHDLLSDLCASVSYNAKYKTIVIQPMYRKTEQKISGKKNPKLSYKGGYGSICCANIFELIGSIPNDRIIPKFCKDKKFGFLIILEL